jgi:hypothetical protein
MNPAGHIQPGSRIILAFRRSFEAGGPSFRCGRLRVGNDLTLPVGTNPICQGPINANFQAYRTAL